MPSRREVIEIDETLCDGCGECVSSCHEGALRIIDGKARLVSDSLCDGLGACLGECPQGAIKIIERKAPFVAPAGVIGVGADIPVLPTDVSPELAGEGSFLSHWPIQIRLVHPQAPFFHNADLVVAADCVPVACPTFHRDFLRDHAVLIGCPKFDDLSDYADRFARIFAASDIRKVTVVVMQVPCCQSLPLAVQRGLEAAGKQIPIEKVVISTDGRELGRAPLAVSSSLR